ncbi:MAG: C-terminal binding protein [Bacillota bacterium]
MFNILITGSELPHIDREQQALRDIAVVAVENCDRKADLIEAVKNADAIMTDAAVIDAEIIANAKKLKVIVEYGIGVDNIDVEFATKKGVYVCNVPDVYIREVAEHALALLLTVARNIKNMSDLVMTENIWDFNRFPALKLFGKTLGIVGCGKIGQTLAKMAKAFGLKVIAYDPYVAAETLTAVGIAKSDLDYLLRNSDIISLHIPHTKETHRLIGKKEISIMKGQAILINVARGGIVDEDALAEALQTGKLYGAGLDVLEAEPSVKANSLLDCNNVIITPHMAWKSEVAAEALEMAAVREVRSVLLEDKPINLVNRQLRSNKLD